MVYGTGHGVCKGQGMVWCMGQGIVWCKGQGTVRCMGQGIVWCKGQGMVWCVGQGMVCVWDRAWCGCMGTQALCDVWDTSIVGHKHYVVYGTQALYGA